MPAARSQSTVKARLRRVIAVVAVFLVAGAPTALAQEDDDPGTGGDDVVADTEGLDPRIIELESRIVSLEARIIDVSPAPTPEGLSMPSDVLFAFGSAELTADAQVALDQVAETLTDAPAGTVSIIGHTDSVGDDASNQTLSEARASAVHAYLEPAVGRDDLTYDIQGRGESEPVAPNESGGQDNPEGRRQNRRVDITIPSV